MEKPGDQRDGNPHSRRTAEGLKKSPEPLLSVGQPQPPADQRQPEEHRGEKQGEKAKGREGGGVGAQHQCEDGEISR